jgi:MFS transporter, ACS family, solute carrier family 17 (sodium-dependent inorganic phosphate cotransporter), other
MYLVEVQVNMSVALIPMANELGWSTTQRGMVSAAFFWGYAATQIPAGYIATRIGGAKVLLAGVMVWSIGVSRTPPPKRPFALMQ